MLETKLGTLAERLKWARDKFGWTQQELADRASTTRDQIQKIELGTTKRPRNVKELADALQTSPSWLLFGDDRIDTLSKEAIDLAVEWQQLPEDLQEAVKRMIAAVSDG